MTVFYKVIRAIMVFLSKTVFIAKCYGFDKLDACGKVIICCNHTSALDVIGLIAASKKRQIFFMGKKELFKFKPLGYIFSKMGVFPVDRGGNDFGAIKKSQDILKAGGLLCIFPEGTRSKTGEMLKGKAGAALIAIGTKTPIIPISIYREGKMRPFAKTTLRCGDAISYEKLKEIKKSDEGLQGAINYVMEQIKSLWEMKH